MENGNGQTPAPKISGFSTPVGSSTARKQESPAQRSNTINQQNAPAQPKPTMKQQFRQERPVTQEEVDAFRKKRSRNRKITAIVIILVFRFYIGIKKVDMIFLLNVCISLKLCMNVNKFF